MTKITEEIKKLFTKVYRTGIKNIGCISGRYNGITCIYGAAQEKRWLIF